MFNFFNKLPDELLVEIFKNNSKEDLEKLVQVNKRFNGIINQRIKPCIKICDLIHCKIHYLFVNRTSTISALKKQIESETEIKPKRQTLIYNGKKLKDNDKTIANYGLTDITKESNSLQLVERILKRSREASSSKKMQNKAMYKK